MKKLISIVLIVWTVCFAICAVEIVRELHRAVKCGRTIRYTYFVNVALWCLFMAPLGAALIGGSCLFDLADWIYDKTHKKDEDEDIRV